MKYILVLVVIWVGYYLWRKARIADMAEKDRPKRDTSKPVVMVACAHCGTHMPSSEALCAGADFYCSADHRDRHAD